MDPPEAAVGVLRNVHRMCEPGGIVLDLTCVPPAARIEVGGRLLGRLDQKAFLDRVARTEMAVELLIDEVLFVEESSLVHEVLNHFDDGPDAIADVDARGVTRLPAELRDRLAAVADPVTEHAMCLVRRLRVLPG